MLLRAKSQQIYYIIIYIIALILPTYYILFPIFIILLSLCWLIQFNASEFIDNITDRKALWPLIIFYVLHVVGYFYSTDKNQALFDLQQKLSFIILPIIIGTGPKLENKHLEKTLTFYIIGITIAALACFCRSVIIWKNSGTTNQFFYHNLVHVFSPNAIYFALYTLFSMSTLLLYPWTEKHIFKNKFIYYLVAFTQMIFYILLSSKTFLILLVILVAPIYIKKILKQMSLPWEQIITLISLIIVVGLIIFTHNPIRSRYEQIFQNNKMEYWLPDNPNRNQKFNNLTLRLFIWKTSFENINENNLWITGCGTGDVKIFQKNKILSYKYKMYENPSETPIWEFNAHNQYIQTLFMIGLPGLIVLFVILLTPFRLIKKINYSTILLIFNISFILLLLQESSFQTQAGIAYYIFFYTIFVNIWYTSVKNSL